jgi:CHAT domain-containing protein
MQPRPLSATEIQKLLTSDTLLLEYALGRQRSYVWAVSAESITACELPGRVEVEAAARRVYELLTARQPVIGETETQRQARVTKADSEYPAAAQALSQMVLGPVASQLGGKRLLIAADGALQYVPFAALPVPQAIVNATSSQQAARDHGPPLIVEHEVVSVPSASALAILRRETTGRKRAEKSVAVFADPVFDKDDDRVKLTAKLRPTRETPDKAKYAEFAKAIRDVGATDSGGRIPRLPFSREEADAIVAVAPGADGMKATGFKATRERASAADLAHYRIVHFATHAFLNDRHPELSGVVLSLVDEYGRPQDGFLRLHELYNLNLPVELVVLSACQTGLGKEIRGEGLVGLTRGFMYAGAPRVVASLWKVGDLGTAQLMSFFYRGMLKEGLRPAAALRAAQVAMLKQKRWQAPYYWAGFVLQGEWR